jgi:hypothetical protein
MTLVIAREGTDWYRMTRGIFLPLTNHLYYIIGLQLVN